VRKIEHFGLKLTDCKHISHYTVQQNGSKAYRKEHMCEWSWVIYDKSNRIIVEICKYVVIINSLCIQDGKFQILHKSFLPSYTQSTNYCKWLITKVHSQINSRPTISLKQFILKKIGCSFLKQQRYLFAWRTKL